MRSGNPSGRGRFVCLEILLDQEQAHTRRTIAALCTISLPAMLLLSAPAHAATWTLAPWGDDGADGSVAAPLATLSEALQRAGDGDVIRLTGGTYSVPGQALTADLILIGDAGEEVILMAEHDGLIITDAAVRLSRLTLTGGDGSGVAIQASEAELELVSVSISDFLGTGLQVSDSRLDLSGGRLAAHGPAARLIDSDAVISDAIIQGIVPGLEPDYLVYASGGQLTLSHSTMTGAHRGCLKGYDDAEIAVSDSVITACGVLFGEGDGESMVHYAVVLTDAVGSATHSLINPAPVRPHEYGIYGDLNLDESVLWGKYPGYRGWAERDGVLSISVDDKANLDNALSVADEMSSRGLHMTYFMNVRYDWSLTDGEWQDVRGLVADGHDVGGHAATNARLTQEIPMLIAWQGSGESAAVVSGEGTLLTVTDASGALLVLDLTDPDSDTMAEVCDLIDALDEHDCWLNDEFSSARSTYVDATALADGSVSLTAEGAGLPYDQRLPSAGGRHFTAEILTPLQLIEDGIGDGYGVVSFAYPGQEHSALVRDAVEEAGIHIARGAGGYSTADHLLTETFDRLQSPIALSNEVIRGPDYETLSADEQRARIELFVASFASMAMEYSAMGALTIHGEETFSAEELSWLLDAVARTDLRVYSMRELSAYIDEVGGTGRYTSIPAPAEHDYQLSDDSLLIDAGSVDDARVTDRLGNPIYGIPDIGPHEHQPWEVMGTSPLAVGSTIRLYADGAFRTLTAGIGPTAPLQIAPLGGFPEHGPTQRRAHLLDLSISRWEEAGRVWSVAVEQPAEALCMRIGSLSAGERVSLRRGGESLGGTTVGPDGAVAVVVPVPDGEQTFTLLPEQDGSSAPELEPCEEVQTPAPDLTVVSMMPLPAEESSSVSTSRGCSHTPRLPALLLPLLSVLLVGLRRRG